jgi:serine/threonine protein kinase
MQHVNSPLPPPTKYNPRIPQALEQVVKKALHKEPERRYTSAEAMRKALQESLKKSIEEGATIPGHLPAVDQSPNRRVTAPPAVSERAEYAARPAPTSPQQPDRLPPSMTPASRAEVEARAGTSRWTSLIIIVVVIILIISLALGIYFAFIKSGDHPSLSPLVHIDPVLVMNHSPGAQL